MSTELFEGQPEELQARLDALIGGGSTINLVVPTNVRAIYIIIYT